MTDAQPERERIFTLMLVAKPDSDPVRAIRWLLKTFQLRCVEMREIKA